ncbi:Methyltransferase domain-containing protein [Amycolatopsis marina]|uniref:Methyltransferase domain-containing protein n=1 Tax=Amycolatopsis marina TaxID=490629 RepID=A0A1I1C1I1_9PSEU|nr:class I SAM-dependent methyltransferase [Amycolatopsis marina]SFB54738.1 Methyltransferase domain-containing protein [Amycolatopsis marina]
MAIDGAVPVSNDNAEQLSAWDGDQGTFWADRADRIDEGVARYHEHLMAAARIGATDIVLDIGCGNGQATRDAARRATAGWALGVDLSSRMLELARRLAERDQLSNVTLRQADAQTHPFPSQSFDLAISRHGAMFFGDPPAAFANIARAMRPAARLVLLSWQLPQHNEWLTAFRAAFTSGRPVPPLDRTHQDRCR